MEEIFSQYLSRKFIDPVPHLPEREAYKRLLSVLQVNRPLAVRKSAEWDENVPQVGHIISKLIQLPYNQILDSKLCQQLIDLLNFTLDHPYSFFFILFPEEVGSILGRAIGQVNPAVLAELFFKAVTIEPTLVNLQGLQRCFSYSYITGHWYFLAENDEEKRIGFQLINLLRNYLP